VITVKILFVFPPAKASNEIDTFRLMDDVTITTVGADSSRRDVDILLRSFCLPYVGAYDRWSAGLGWYLNLDSIIDEIRASDVVVTYEIGTVTTTQIGAIASRLGVPSIAIAAQTIIDYPIYRLPPWRQYVKRNSHRLDGVICLNERAAACAISFGLPADRVHVNAFAIDTDDFYPAPQRTPKLTVTFLGDLRPEKGVIDAIAAADIAAPQIGAAFTFRVVGDGPLRDKVAALASTRPWMEVMGRVARTGVPNVLRDSRAVMTASYTRRHSEEQFGFALVEGMAAGLPVVSTMCGSIPTVVPPGNFLSPEHDIEGLAAGILAALDPAADQVGASNRLHVLEHYSSKVQAIRLRSLITDIIADPHRREHL
jgi:glycosyltransferase involved in cell wall biosynthesis